MLFIGTWLSSSSYSETVERQGKASIIRNATYSGPIEGRPYTVVTALPIYMLIINAFIFVRI